MRNIKHLPLCAISVFYAHPALADFVQYFKDEQGETNWQYVANFSSGVLIILLSVVVVSLFFSHRRARRANRALEQIKNVLEDRVVERTATLDESNRLLKDSNEKLAAEIEQHKQTASLLRSSENYINSILQSMPLMLVGLDEAMNVTQWNRWAEKITGVKASTILGKNLWDCYPTISISKEQVAQVLQEDKPINIKHSQRSQYYLDITIYPLDKNVQPGLVVLIDDVTQRILAENKLIQRDKMSSMGELASYMAHDIDTPLQFILQKLRDIEQHCQKNETELVQKAAHRALEKGRQAVAIINNLLQFSESNADKMQPAHITEVIDHSLDLAASILSLPNGLDFSDVKIVRQYQQELPTIPCYVSELEQVFLSFFRHALYALSQSQFTDNEATIHIEVMECYEALWIKVQHNGLGMNAEEQQYIFEPFFRNDQNDPNADISKRLSFPYFIITDHHRGQIAVTSDRNIGTTFHIQLPLAK